MIEYETLRLAWWIIIAILCVGFTITDGFDLGVGILFPFIGRTDTERRIMINSIGPHWEGNQVWLVSAAGALFAAWPMVYAAAFSGFYIALIFVLCALFFRPLAFDYRSKIASPLWRSVCDWCLFTGSFVPALIFGVAFGNLLLGVPVKIDSFFHVTYEGGFLGLLNPFGLLAGLVGLSLMLTHGAVWLQIKTTREIYARARRLTQTFALVTVITFALAGLWIIFGIRGFEVTSAIDFNGPSNPLVKTVVRTSSWLMNFHSHPYLWAIPALGLLFPILTIWFSSLNRNGMAFLSSALTITCVLLTFGIATFPFVMPSSVMPNASLTMWDSTSSYHTLTIMTWVVGIFVPVMILYTIWTYIKLIGRLGKTFIKENNHSLY